MICCPSQCGFSRTTVGLLSEAGFKDFGHFDILTDNEVRQGLKEYSKWPTYPQLYVDGELIGGLDVIKVGRVSVGVVRWLRVALHLPDAC